MDMIRLPLLECRTVDDPWVIFPGWSQVAVESVLVGSYTVLLFFVIQQVFYSADWNLFLFVLGFCKHALGYLLGIQNFYCRYGYACRQKARPSKRKTTGSSVWDIYAEKMVECLLEGLAFVFVGNFVSFVIMTDRAWVVFATGCLLHVVAEMAGIHAYFCEKCRE